MNLDQLAGGLCGVSASAVFFLHAASDPARKSWITLPSSVRWGFALVGMTFAVWSADLFSIADRAEVLGHVNVWGVLSVLAMAYLAVASVVCVCQHRLRDSQWRRLQEVERAARADPDLTPAAIPKAKVGAVVQALGGFFNTKPAGADEKQPRDG